MNKCKYCEKDIVEDRVVCDKCAKEIEDSQVNEASPEEAEDILKFF